MRRTIDRRTFLRGAGVALGLPWLEAARGADVEPPMRMVFVCTALGLHAPALFPKRVGAGYEATEYLEILERHREEFTLFSGLSHPDQGGEHATLMTWLSAARNPGQDGFRNSVSVDQYAAEKLGYVTRFPSVVLSSEGAGSQSYNSSGVMVPAESSPSRLFGKMFLQGTPAEVERQRQKLAEGRSILDELGGQAKALGRDASAADRERLDEYFESVRRAERDLVEAEAWIGRPKPKVDAGAPVDIADKSDLVGRAKLALGLVPLILQSDSSRIVSVVIQDHQVVPQIEGVTFEHHNLSHHGKDPAKISQLKRIEAGIVGCFGEFLDGMKVKSEAGGTLLDRAMVMFGSNLGNANAHDPRNLPILLAGGSFGHGKYVAHGGSDNTPLSDLFVRMLQEMGVGADSFATSRGVLEW